MNTKQTNNCMHGLKNNTYHPNSGIINIIKVYFACFKFKTMSIRKYLLLRMTLNLYAPDRLARWEHYHGNTHTVQWMVCQYLEV